MSAGTSVLGMTPLAILGQGSELYQGLGTLTGACIFYNSDSTVVPALMALFHDFSGDRTDHKIADLENGMYDKTVLRRFSQLTGRITDQHVCLVCVLVYLQTQSVLATSIWQACISNSRYLWIFSRIAG